MSSGKLSAAVQKNVLRILKTDLRNELNTLVPELEFNKAYTIDFLEKEYGVTNSQAIDMFYFIIADINRDPRMSRKKGVKGKTFVYSPTGSDAANKYGVLKSWKTRVSKDLEAKFGTEDFGSKFHLGHGASSIPTVGYRAVKAAQYLLGKKGSAAMLGVINESPLIKDLTIDTDVKTIFTTGKKFRKNYTVRLKLQHGGENLAEATEEKLENKKLIKALEDLALNAESSPSSISIISKSLDMSIKGKKSGALNLSSNAHNTFRNTKKGRKGARPKPKVRDKRGRFTSLLSLQSIINQQLAEKIKQNMVTPALVNRTGRFAESVSIERLTMSRQGRITAFYSYMKYPYQTFERGHRQGSTRRDPRLLISKSIREIATALISAKFDIRTRRI